MKHLNKSKATLSTLQTLNFQRSTHTFALYYLQTDDPRHQASIGTATPFRLEDAGTDLTRLWYLSMIFLGKYLYML